METTKLKLIQFAISAVLCIPLGMFLSRRYGGYSYLTGALIGLGFSVLAYILLVPKHKCSLCSAPFNLHVIQWEDQMSTKERVNLESYVDVGKIHQCRQCKRLYCLDCAFRTNYHCRFCDSWGLRTGYYAK